MCLYQTWWKSRLVSESKNMKYLYIGIYCLIGIGISLTSSVTRKHLTDIKDDFTIAKLQQWKIITATLIIYGGVIFFWPIFLLSLYGKQQPYDERISVINVKTFNKSWLRKRISVEEAIEKFDGNGMALFKLTAGRKNNAELWVFSTNEEKWKRQYEGVVIIVDNEIIDGFFLRDI